MRFAVLVSGEGSNLQELLDWQSKGQLVPAEIALVVSNNVGVRAIERARAAGVASAVIDHREFPDRARFETALLDRLRAATIDAVVLAGFMRILTETFLGAYKDRVINTHPSLLPAFPGIHAAQQALDHGVKVTGCTVHLVDAGVDTGAIISQAAVSIDENDDADSLQRRIQARERVLLPQAVRLLARGRLQRHGRRVRIGQAE